MVAIRSSADTFTFVSLEREQPSRSDRLFLFGAELRRALARSPFRLEQAPYYATAAQGSNHVGSSVVQDPLPFPSILCVLPHPTQPLRNRPAQASAGV